MFYCDDTNIGKAPLFLLGLSPFCYLKIFYTFTKTKLNIWIDKNKALTKLPFRISTIKQAVLDTDSKMRPYGVAMSFVSNRLSKAWKGKGTMATLFFLSHQFI